VRFFLSFFLKFLIFFHHFYRRDRTRARSKTSRGCRGRDFIDGEGSSLAHQRHDSRYSLRRSRHGRFRQKKRLSHRRSSTRSNRRTLHD
jgi:hypothetical protein